MISITKHCVKVLLKSRKHLVEKKKKKNRFVED